MSDVVVTLPMNFEYGNARGIRAWIAEGDPAGTPWSGEEWGWYMGGFPPCIEPGERVYVVHRGKLRGYAPLTRIQGTPPGFALIRRGDAVAVTVPFSIPGFRGFRYRWWERDDEVPFPDWRTP